MAGKSVLGMFAACAVYLSNGLVAGVEAADPPYVFLLRSRDAVVTPERSKHGETGGGFIQVTQIEPNVVMAVMRGAAAAGDDHGGKAAMQFTLNQDVEILPTRNGLRPPRLIVAAWAIGSLHSALKNGGMAEHAPACAVIRSAGEPVLNLCIKPHGVAGGENLLVNERIGPLEAVVAPGAYCLSQTFAINAVQERSCHSGSAAAHFDPDPKLEAHWNEVLKPFRAVPHRDFGFRVILRVVEDTPPPSAAPPGASELPPPREQKPGPPILDGENSTH